ncbi:MAG TPA: hypothetical protein PKB14_21970 [Rubrivivax sp.]|nr:hypothetical protein [Rubrivivax sp.]
MLMIGTLTALAARLTLDLYLPGGLIEGTHDLANVRTAAFAPLRLSASSKTRKGSLGVAGLAAYTGHCRLRSAAATESSHGSCRREAAHECAGLSDLGRDADRAPRVRCG